MKPDDLTPAQSAQLLAIGFVLLVVLMASVASWIIFLARSTSGKTFQIAKGPLATVGFIDLFLGILLLLGLSFVSAQAWYAIKGKPAVQETSVQETSVQEKGNQTLRQNGDEPDASQKTKSDSAKGKGSPWKNISADEFLFSGWLSVAQLSAAVSLVFLIILRTGASWRSLGMVPRDGPKDLAIGLWVLFLTLPCLLAVSGIVSHLSGIEYSHPVIDTIRNYPWLIWLVAWQAVIVAPITEEFLFRTVLIGWFESAHYGRSPFTVLYGWMPSSTSVPESEIEIIPATQQSAVQPFSDLYESKGPFSGNDGRLSDATGNDEGTSTDRYTPPWWPAIVSGFLFGLAHASYGVSWLPLAVFGVILGRVYQFRQSLLMCIVIHMFFNAINLLNLWLGIDLPKS